MRFITIRKHRWKILVFAIAVISYFALYLHFRINHTFIHRAGNYAADISHGRPRFPTNHFIEAGKSEYGPLVFAATLMNSNESENFNAAEYENNLRIAAEHAQREEKKRRFLFLFFEPAAILEIVVWKVIDPEPL